MKSPPYLMPNDKVQIVSPSKIFDKDALEAGINILKSWKLEVILSANLYATYHQFSGTDDQRTSDLQSALDDSNIKAIFCVRGGYGTGRIIDQLDFTKFIKNPKWICGFSDITFLLSKINTLNIQCLHSAMVSQFANSDYTKSTKALKNLLFGKSINYSIKSSRFNKWGSATAPVIGGNLTILHNQLDTKSEVDLKGKILFIEDVGEYLYHIDRMMVHLKRSNRLRHLKGLIVGYFSQMKDGEPTFCNSFEEIILESVREYNFPVVFNFPAGHIAPNFPIIFGRELHLDVQPGKASISYN